MMDLPDITIGGDTLKDFYPLESFSSDELNLIVQKMQLNHMQRRETLFQEGSNDADVIYLIQGSIKLTTNSGESFVLEAGSDQARYPIANLKPRRFSARVESESASIAKIPSSVLEPFMSTHANQRIQIKDNTITDDSELKIFDSDWMMALVKIPPFKYFSHNHIEKLFNVMEEIKYKAGDTVVSQGDPGDYFYLIKKGKCMVSRNNGSKEIALAELATTDSFGEEALLTNEPRNATVRMVTNGRLMRISNENFQRFLRDKVIHWVDPGEAGSILKKGAITVDLTQQDDQSVNLKDAVKIPPFLLRTQMKKLSRKNTYLLVCDTDEECAVASYLLSLRGLESYVLKGGASNLAAIH